MTPKQIELMAERYSEARADFHKSDPELADLTHYESCRAFRIGADFALSHQWISVQDALPENDGLVLAHFSDIDPKLSHAMAYHKGGMWHTPDDWYFDCEIDFWMPIPPNI